MSLGGGAGRRRLLLELLAAGAQVTSCPLRAYRPSTAWQPSWRSNNDPECGKPITKGMDHGSGWTGSRMGLLLWGPEDRCFPQDLHLDSP